ncbi:hypothetical protein MRX96_023084 [Rhipicephalus microplus]
MFAKKKKKPIISAPSNFEHRVHTGFDRREGRFVGLPPQWASLIGGGQDRPKPIIDPSNITPHRNTGHEAAHYRERWCPWKHKPCGSMSVTPGWACLGDTLQLPPQGEPPP